MGVAENRTLIAATFGLLVTLVAAFAPTQSADYLAGAFALVVVSVMWWGSRDLPEGSKAAWRSIAVASLLFGLGAWVRNIHGQLVGIDYPLPSPADLLFLPAYWLFAARYSFSSGVALRSRRSSPRSMP